MNCDFHTAFKHHQKKIQESKAGCYSILLVFLQFGALELDVRTFVLWTFNSRSFYHEDLWLKLPPSTTNVIVNMVLKLGKTNETSEN